MNTMSVEHPIFILKNVNIIFHYLEEFKNDIFMGIFWVYTFTL